MLGNVRFTASGNILIKALKKEELSWKAMLESTINGKKENNFILCSKVFSISYNYQDSSDTFDIKLKTKDEFFYDDIEIFLDKIDNRNLSCDLEKSYVDAARFFSVDKIILVPNKKPFLSIRCKNESVRLRPLCLADIENRKSNYNKLIYFLYNECRKKDIDVFIHKTGTIELRDVLMEDNFMFYLHGLLEEFFNDKNAILSEERFTCIAIRNFAENEMKFLLSVANCPEDHPLKKYVVAASAAIDVFIGLSKSNTYNIGKPRKGMLRSALRGEEIFDDMPPIIMRSFVGLRCRFSNVFGSFCN